MYVETNFILGYATGRTPGFDSLLNQAAHLAVPEVCLMEAITTEKSIAVAQATFVKTAREQQGEIGRTQHFRPAAEFVTSMDEAISAYDKVRADFRLRLYTALDVLRSQARIVPTSRTWFADFEQRGSLIPDPTDELVHASIREHALGLGGAPALFFSEDKGYLRPSVREAFASAGVRVTTSVGDVIGHLEERAK